MITDHISQVEVIISAPLEKVWAAFTEADIFKKWFFGTQLKTNWELGNPIEFSGVYDGHAYLDKGEVLEYIPNEKFSYSYLSQWAGLADTPENYLKVSCEMTPDANNTRVKITQSNYDKDKIEHSLNNWISTLEELKKLLE